ncbi:MAG: outer membrane protein assembly factor BamE, partial [Gammaproteobacteria bacterium]|nr:outer membrane protein assembly factor BamE [Gammaproteobacteria bacterium]
SRRTISKKMRILLLSFLFLTTALSGCLSVYRVEVQQGNVVTQEMIDKLKPGMTRSQVRFVLGTPLVTDAFHPDRWDYYSYIRPSNEKTGQTRRLTVIFKDDSLLSVHSEKPLDPESKSPAG